MYLSDREIRQRLDEFVFQTDNDGLAFDPNDQIQPCSVDLRLDSVFWLPKRRWKIDLRSSKLLDIQPRRYYKRLVLKEGDSYILKPGKLVLGRIYESFKMPDDCAGEITGRSSFARLGLAVNCSSGFINPGWKGQMPLQLVNFNPNAIRLVPHLPICQLRVVKLSQAPERVYGQSGLESKYMDDDGGPSYWWRDKRIRNLHDRLTNGNIDTRIEQRALEVFGGKEPEVIERFTRQLESYRVGQIDNTDSVLESFAKKERRRRGRRLWGINIARGAFLPLLLATIRFLSVKPYVAWHYVVWALFALSIYASYYAWKTEVGDYFTDKDLENFRRMEERDRTSAPIGR